MAGGFSWIIRRTASRVGFGGIQQFVEFQPVTTGNLFEGEKAGVFLNPNLVKLVELVADCAHLGGVFLRPPARLSQGTNSILKQLRGGVPHASNFPR